MKLSERITRLRKANPKNIYELDTAPRSIYLLAPQPGNAKPDQQSRIISPIYTATCVYSESETEAY